VERGGEASVFRRVCFRRNKLGAARKDWEVSELFRVREITEHRVIASSVSKIYMERMCQEKIFAVIDVACCKHVFSVVK
jgi:hypothetical protein